MANSIGLSGSIGARWRVRSRFPFRNGKNDGNHTLQEIWVTAVLFLEALKKVSLYL